MQLTKVTSNTSAQLLISENVNRKRLLIENKSATITVYIGNSEVSLDNGFPIPPGKQLLDKNYNGAYYVISDADADVVCIEEEL